MPCIAAPLCDNLVSKVSNATFDILKGDGQQHASVVKVICNAYYELIGPETITCEQGNWLTDIPQCQRKCQCFLGIINMCCGIHRITCHYKKRHSAYKSMPNKIYLTLVSAIYILITIVFIFQLRPCGFLLIRI